MVTITVDDLWPLLLFAVRYAMGRRSYGPGLVCDMLHRYVAHLTPEQRTQVAREIREEAALHTLGYQDQHSHWLRTATWLEGERHE